MATILLAIDACTPVEKLLPAAVLLATQHRAGLLAVFVEDIRLTQTAALPFTTEIGMLTGVCHQLTAESIELRLKHIAEEVRRQLAAAAERRRVPWEFRVSRGTMAQILRDTEADIVLAGQSGFALLPVSKQIARRQEAADARCLLVIDDGTAAAKTAIDVGRTLVAANHHSRLVILALNASGEPSPRHRHLTGTDREIEIRVATVSQLVGQIRRIRPSLMLIARNQDMAENCSVRRELEAIRCPLAILNPQAVGPNSHESGNA